MGRVEFRKNAKKLDFLMPMQSLGLAHSAEATATPTDDGDPTLPLAPREAYARRS